MRVCGSYKGNQQVHLGITKGLFFFAREHGTPASDQKYGLKGIKATGICHVACTELLSGLPASLVRVRGPYKENQQVHLGNEWQRTAVSIPLLLLFFRPFLLFPLVSSKSSAIASSTIVAAATAVSPAPILVSAATAAVDP